MALGREVQAVVTGQRSVGVGDAYRLHPALPEKGAFEYVQQVATVVLLLLALGVFAYYLAESPKTAVRMALARVGMRP